MTMESKGRGSKSTRLRREIFLGTVMIKPHVKEFLKHSFTQHILQFPRAGLIRTPVNPRIGPESDGWWMEK